MTDGYFDKSLKRNINNVCSIRNGITKVNFDGFITVELSFPSPVKDSRMKLNLRKPQE